MKTERIALHPIGWWEVAWTSVPDVMVVEAFLLKLQTTDVNFMLMLVVRSGHVSMIHPLKAMRGHTFHGYLFTNYFHLNQGIRVTFSSCN